MHLCLCRSGFCSIFSTSLYHSFPIPVLFPLPSPILSLSHRFLFSFFSSLSHPYPYFPLSPSISLYPLSIPLTISLYPPLISLYLPLSSLYPPNYLPPSPSILLTLSPHYRPATSPRTHRPYLPSYPPRFSDSALLTIIPRSVRSALE